MDQALRQYLDVHRVAVNATALEIARNLGKPGDTDGDARRLVRDARVALHEAISSALSAGPVEGRRRGEAGEVCVIVHVPPDGSGKMGRVNATAARFDTTALIPCPDDWPQTLPLPPGLADRLHRMIFPPPEGPRLMDADEAGRVSLGASKAGVAYVMEELPEGEIWLRPLNVAEEQEN